MSGQRSSDGDGGAAESVAAGCVLRETRRGSGGGNNNGINLLAAHRRVAGDGLAVFTWGRGEDGQLGLGDTADQDEPTYVRPKNVCLLLCGMAGRIVYFWNSMMNRKRTSLLVWFVISFSHFA